MKRRGKFDTKDYAVDHIAAYWQYRAAVSKTAAQLYACMDRARMYQQAANGVFM